MSRSVQDHRFAFSNIVVSGHQAWTMALGQKNLRDKRSHYEPIYLLRCELVTDVVTIWFPSQNHGLQKYIIIKNKKREK